MTQLRFKADRVSGIDGCIFALSVVLELIFWLEKRTPFTFPFYGLSFDEKNHTTEWIDNEKYERLSDEIHSRIEEEGLTLFEDILRTVRKETEDFMKRTAALLPRISALSDKKLVEAFEKITGTYFYYYGPGGVTFPYEGIISDRLYRSLSQRVPNAGEIIAALLRSEYKSFMIESELALEAIRAEQDETKREKLVSEYLKDFFFIEASYADAPRLSREKVLERAGVVHAHREKHAGAVKMPDLLPLEQNIVELLRLTEIIRDQRKKLNLIGSYTMFRFLDEASKRTGVERELLKRMFWFEYPRLLEDPKGLKKNLEARTSASIVYDGEKYYYLDYDALEPREASTHASSLKGTPASSGKAEGPARIILGKNDFREV